MKKCKMMNTGTNLEHKNELSNSDYHFSAHPEDAAIDRFKNYCGSDYPLTRKNTSKNARLLESKVSNKKSYLLFCLICFRLKESRKDLLKSMTVDLNNNLFSEYSFGNKYRFNRLRSELVSLNVISKVNKDNVRCTLYYLNPSFYNVLSSSQRIEYRNEWFGKLFVPFPD